MMEDLREVDKYWAKFFYDNISGQHTYKFVWSRNRYVLVKIEK